MSHKRAIISVINDLVTDQRVDRTARVLLDLGFEVLIVGRHKHDSLRMPPRPYEVNRMRLIWEKGPLFYAEYNIRLFFLLLFQKSSLLVSNDLDTLMPNYFISRMKRIPLVFDSHEYFTETPELVERKRVQNTWRKIEGAFVPKIRDCITVNESIAELFREKYGKIFSVVRNIPPSRPVTDLLTREELGLPADRKLILLQGAGINIQRGAEEAVQAMKYVDDAYLLIVGGGDVLPLLKTMVTDLDLGEKVIFIPKQPPEKLVHFTRNCSLGLTLDKDTNINYRYSLPNKLFDYIHAGIPVLATPLPEIRNIITRYGIGDFIGSHEPEHIALKMKQMLTDSPQREQWLRNLDRAREELTWEKEQQVLVDIFKQYA